MGNNHSFKKKYLIRILLLGLSSFLSVLLIEGWSGWQMKLVVLGMSVLVFISSGIVKVRENPSRRI